MQGACLTTLAPPYMGGATLNEASPLLVIHNAMVGVRALAA